MSEINVQLKNGEPVPVPGSATVAEALKKLDRDVAKQALAAKVGGREVDLTAQLDALRSNGEAVQIEPIVPQTRDGLEVLRGPASQLLASADRQIGGTSFPLPRQKAELGELALQFRGEFATGYRIALAELCKPNGSVPFINVLRSSGYAIYDDYAVNAVKLAQFPPIPDAFSKTGVPIQATFSYVVQSSLTNILR